MGLRSPLGRVLGLGSAKQGVDHWWWQRVTAIALIPTGLWFVYSLLTLLGADQATIVTWFGSPLHSAAFILFALGLFWHSFLGLQVVIEDYVHHEWWKICLLVGLKLALMLAAIMVVVMTLQISVAD